MFAKIYLKQISQILRSWEGSQDSSLTEDCKLDVLKTTLTQHTSFVIA